MKIILTQAELEQAVEAHVRSQIAINPNQNIGIEFVVTRGVDGITATLDIAAATAPAPAKKPAFRGGPTAVPATPMPAKAEAEPVATKATPFRLPTKTAELEEADPEEESLVPDAEEATDAGEPFVLNDEVTDAEPEEEAKPAPTASSIFSKARTAG